MRPLPTYPGLTFLLALRSIRRHVLRNALLPSITIIGLQIGYLAGGTAGVETVFSRDGVGRLTVDAVLVADAWGRARAAELAGVAA